MPKLDTWYALCSYLNLLLQIATHVTLFAAQHGEIRTDPITFTVNLCCLHTVHHNIVYADKAAHGDISRQVIAC